MAAKINISRLLSQISDFGHDANRSAVSVTNETTQINGYCGSVKSYKQ
jgi:hypothetical protein